jgi:hypothetical protein
MAGRERDRHNRIIARPEQGIVAIPGIENGERVIYYEIDEPKTQRLDDAKRLERIRALAGAWSDLDADEVLDALDRIRHSNPPSPPIDLDD